MYRTHTCGALRIENVNENVCLSGWVQKIRNLGDTELPNWWQKNLLLKR